MLIRFSEIIVCFILSLGLHLDAGVDADNVEMETSEIHVGVQQGQKAVLPCMINLNGDFKVKWRNGAGTILSTNGQARDPRKHFVDTSFPREWNLHIKHARETDAGRYKCYTDGATPQLYRIVILRVDVPPQILTSGTVNAKEGERLVVFCNATGSPKPTITWYKEDTLLPEYDSEILVMNTTSRDDAGQYKCTATNGVQPSDSETFTVDILYQPKVVAINERIFQYKYKEAIVQCKVSANPVGKVSWYKNGNELLGSWKYRIEGYMESDGSWITMLTVDTIDRSDFGEYICLAVNEVGSDSSVVRVIEMVRPPSPKTTQTTTTTTSTTTASPHTGNQENLVEVPDNSASSKSPPCCFNINIVYTCLYVILMMSMFLT